MSLTLRDLDSPSLRVFVILTASHRLSDNPPRMDYFAPLSYLYQIILSVVLLESNLVQMNAAAYACDSSTPCIDDQDQGPQ